MEEKRRKNPQEPLGHDFGRYALDWFEVFSKAHIDRTTAITYERQLKKHILPAFDGLCVEEITPADVQKLFNAMDAETAPKAKATKQKVKNVLNMILQQAAEDHLITRNPLCSRSIRIQGRPSASTPLYSVAQMQYIAPRIWATLPVNMTATILPCMPCIRSDRKKCWACAGWTLILRSQCHLYP